ncbi:MAG: thioredoxin fold domain-containing protein [Bacteroidota bacterium]
MKNNILFFLTIFVFSLTAQAQDNKINWMTFEEAIAAQSKSPKKIMMDAYTDWCGPCKLLDKNTFQNPDVVAYVNKNYYAVKFNAEGDTTIEYQGQIFKNPNFIPGQTGRNAQHQFAGSLQINAYPSIVFFDEQGNPIVPLPGYKNPQELELYLKMFLNDTHKEITTQEDWEKYQKDFVTEFKG